MTALHMAAEEGATDCVRLLIDAGATVGQLNKHGETPALLAAKNGILRAVLALYYCLY